MPERIEHGDPRSAALHILLVVAMDRLGVTRLEATSADYERAGHTLHDLHIRFDGEVYLAERLARETS